MPAHTYYECPQPCEENPNCTYCDAGLLYCTTCKESVTSLTTDCLGESLPVYHQYYVIQGLIDYVGGKWVTVPLKKYGDKHPVLKALSSCMPTIDNQCAVIDIAVTSMSTIHLVHRWGAVVIEVVLYPKELTPGKGVVYVRDHINRRCYEACMKHLTGIHSLREG